MITVNLMLESCGMTIDLRRKLTDEQVSEIRTLRYAARWSQDKLAEHFGISQTHVSMILRGRARPALVELDEPDEPIADFWA